MFRIIQSDYTSRGMTKISRAVKDAKENGETPVLADLMNLNGLAEFALECKKQGVDGLVGLRVPVAIEKDIGFITLIAKSEGGLSNLATIVEKGMGEFNHLDLGSLSELFTDISCLIDHDSPVFSNGTEAAYRSGFAALKKTIPSSELYFSVYQNTEQHLGRNPQMLTQNTFIEKWLAGGKASSLMSHCLPVAYESFKGGAGYQLLLGRYLSLNSVQTPSIGSAKVSCTSWMDGSDSIADYTLDFLSESKDDFISSVDLGYTSSVLRDEEVVDLGVNWILREKMTEYLSDYINDEGIADSIEQEKYKERLESELGVIEREGFEPYFKALISYSEYCRENNIPTKLRGSAAVSLICFLAGLSSSQCDPIKQALDFRRFMGARLETPDIDIDVAGHKRDSIYDFLFQHVSEGSVASLAIQGKQINFHTLFEQAREVMLVRYGEGHEYSFAIPKVSVNDYGLMNDLKADLGEYTTKVLGELVSESKVLKSYMDKSPYLNELVNIGMELTGLRGNSTPHPSAIVVNDHSIRPIPFTKGKSGVIAGVPHEFAKHVGLLKYDILSSKVLKGLDLAKSRLKKSYEMSIKSCFNGDGGGIYQFIKENPVGLNQLTDNAKSLQCLIDINPKSFQELAAFSALIRPGVADRKDYLNRSKNQAFDDDEISKFLAETRGFVIYEDQILQMCIDIAGMEPSDADALRTGLKKGKQSLIDSQKESFLNGLIERGRDSNLAMKIWNRLCKYKGVYLFNKGHATEYAITTVEQALIKRDYPHVFLDTIAQNFDADVSAKHRISKPYIGELLERGIKVSSANINQIHAHLSGYKKEGGGVIYPSLKFYGVSEKMQSALTSAKTHGSIKSLSDYIQKILPEYLDTSRHSLLNTPPASIKNLKEEVDILIKYGFFDQVGISEELDLSGLSIIEARNIAIQASKQLIDYLSDPFPESDNPNLTFEGKLEYTDKEYSELMNAKFGVTIDQAVKMDIPQGLSNGLKM